MPKTLFNSLRLGVLFILLIAPPVLTILAVATGRAELAMQAYWPLAFWTVVALDFHKTQMKEDGASETDPAKFSFADRFLAYLFIAPFIYPVRLFNLVVEQRRTII